MAQLGEVAELGRQAGEVETPQVAERAEELGHAAGAPLKQLHAEIKVR